MCCTNRNYNRDFSSNNSSVKISTANPNLNGSGVLGTVLIAGNDGTLLRDIIIKAATNTQQGMVRFFLSDGITTFLFAEVIIPATTVTGVMPSFSTRLSANMKIQSGYTLYVSTEQADTFNVVAVANNWKNCEC